MSIYNLEFVEQKIQYSFRNKELLKSAITHSSYTNEQKINRIENYERLEFLGDAILEFVSSEFFFLNYPKLSEGELTKMRASLVCETALADVATHLEVGSFLKLGKGEEKMGGRNRASIIADVIEAIIGAIFLDCGMKAAKTFIETFILVDIDQKTMENDSKTILQEKVQKLKKKDLTYQLIEESGPEHDKVFKVAVFVDKEQLGQGIGKSKKLAEQKAAYQALLNWK